MSMKIVMPPTVAVAHSILIAIYHVLKGEGFLDLGSDYYTDCVKTHFKLILMH